MLSPSRNFKIFLTITKKTISNHKNSPILSRKTVLLTSIIFTTTIPKYIHFPDESRRVYITNEHLLEIRYMLLMDQYKSMPVSRNLKTIKISDSSIFSLVNDDVLADQV